MDQATEPPTNPLGSPPGQSTAITRLSHLSPDPMDQPPKPLNPTIDPKTVADKPSDILPPTESAKASQAEDQALGPAKTVPAVAEPSRANPSESPADQPNESATKQSTGTSPPREQVPGPSTNVALNDIPYGDAPSESAADQPIEPSTNLPLARLNHELEHTRIQLGRYWTCIWCQYKKRTLLKGPDRSIKAGRTISGCETCKVALCFKGDCWEEFHKPTIPPTNEPEPPSNLPTRRPKDLPPERLNPELDHRRVQLGPRLICLWCQYKHKRPQPEKPKRSGRSTSGCSTCRVPLCLKTKCWDKFHQPVEPLMSLPEKRLDPGIGHQRIQFEKMKACIWCQYKIKYIQPQSDKSNRPGRSTSGCSGCEVTLCSKNKCWEEFHKPTKPLMTLPPERLDSQLKHQRVQHGDRLMCVWCQYERKYPQPDHTVKRAGRTTSGCSTCQAPLCLKTKCWEEFHAT